MPGAAMDTMERRSPRELELLGTQREKASQYGTRIKIGKL